MFGIKIACAVHAIYRPGDDLHIALMLGISRAGRLRLASFFCVLARLLVIFLRVFFRTRCLCWSRALLAVAALFGQIVRGRGAARCNHLAVRRPCWRTCTARKIGHAPRFATAHGQNINLRRSRTCSCTSGGWHRRRLRGADESQPFSIWRPARRRIVITIGHAVGLLVTMQRHAPDGSVVTIFLVVDRHLDESYTGTIRRNLRIANPVELEKIFLGHRPLLRKRRKPKTNKKNNGRQPYTTMHIRLLEMTDFYSTRAAFSS